MASDIIFSTFQLTKKKVYYFFFIKWRREFVECKVKRTSQLWTIKKIYIQKFIWRGQNKGGTFTFEMWLAKIMWSSKVPIFSLKGVFSLSFTLYPECLWGVLISFFLQKLMQLLRMFKMRYTLRLWNETEGSEDT